MQSLKSMVFLGLAVSSHMLRTFSWVLYETNLENEMASCRHLRDYEVRDLVRTGASIAPCPIANILHSRAVAPVPRYYQLGLTKIGLGTDVSFLILSMGVSDQ